MGNETLQEALQSEVHVTGPHRWRPGQSGNPGGKRAQRLRVENKIAEFAAPYGGIAALAPDEIELLRQAAILSKRRVSDIEQQVRVANALRSIFELLAARHRGKGPSLPVMPADEGDKAAIALHHLLIKKPPEGV